MPLRIEDGADVEAGRLPDGDMREGAKQATLSSCGKRTVMDEADDCGVMDATSRVGVCFGTRLPETFYKDFASIVET